MRDYLQLIDTETHGPRCDVTPLFARPEALNAALTDLWQPFADRPVDLIAGVDALGFILGAALAQKVGLGFLPIRKAGKLPVPVARIEFVDYSGLTKGLEIRKDLQLSGQRVLLVDEWIETGTQVETAAHLIEGQGGVIAGIVTLNMDDNARTRALRERYRCVAANLLA